MAEAVLLIFLTVINLVLWAVFIIRFKKTFSPAILLSDIKNEVDKLLIEINRTVDEDLNLMESRRESLRELLQTVDKRLSVLQKEDFSRAREDTVLQKLSPRKKSRIHLQATENEGQAFSVKGEESSAFDGSRYSSPVSGRDVPEYTPPVQGDGIQLAIDFDAYRINTEDSDPEIRFQSRNTQDFGPEIRFQSRNTQDFGIEILNEAPGEAEKDIPLRDQALKLHAQGLSADLISRKLKLPVSAVQMIIDTFGE